MTENRKLWGGRFTDEPDAAFARFNQSLGFDRRLFAADTKASLAHCEALRRAGVLDAPEATRIAEGLRLILARATEDGAAYFDELSEAEDVHTFIETRLIEIVGDAGRRLHTGRSRNDQVATAMRLWVRDAVDDLHSQIRLVQTKLVESAEANFDAVLPGYTHLQRAQPVLWAHWCLAYFEMMGRDVERFADARRRVNVLPLGSAALAGTSYAIDREQVARQLGFDEVSRNSLDAVSDRDFCVDFTHAAALVMVHLSRMSEDIILYASSEFGFIELSDRVSTGSSLMPQKKNPDAMELVRGKAGRVFGHNMGLLVMMKGLPLAYNKDMQEDKEAVFDAADTVRACLQTTATVIANITLHDDAMRAAATRGYLNATELADYLVGRGMPFRTAHDLTGRIVRHAIERGVELNDLSLEELKSFSALIEPDVHHALTLETTLASKTQTGGTAPSRVREALTAARAKLKSEVND